LNYGTNEPATIELSMAYDNANQIEGPGPAIGLAFGAQVGRVFADTAAGVGPASGAGT